MGGGVGRKGSQHEERERQPFSRKLYIKDFDFFLRSLMKHFLNLKPRSGKVYMAFKGVNRECSNSAHRSQGLYLLEMILSPKNGHKIDKNTENLLFYH